MDQTTRMTRSPWLVGLLVGAVSGVIVLGIGGRIAMRGIALYNGRPTGFSWGGSLTVLVLGAACGAGGGILLVLMRRLVRHRLLRAAIFWTLVGLITLRGLRPVDAVKLSAFVPLILLYGTMLHIVWCRIVIRAR